ncbi:CRAL-TRIO domain containing protein [Dissostichus eleginoides]|uniref:CRAL-TRIO domain containing protein n=1 Tax=Dissostichus eleginoides TaxID=100907 RepID=A0AAD9BXQ1_DISEL|nr:CRAL-TRIO domain containing protein [Dissostichus eleginoides]
MANGPPLSTVTRSLSLLDVLHANQFEGKSFNPEILEETEENFYRGAPPNARMWGDNTGHEGVVGLKENFKDCCFNRLNLGHLKVAEEVVHLFTAGSQGDQKTVLLLVNGVQVLEDLQCLDVFKHANYSHRDISQEDRLDDFRHLIITVQQDGSEKRVRMAHPLIAQCCTELMAEAGVTRSDTAKTS